MSRKLLHVEIRIAGTLDSPWTECFDGLQMETLTPGETRLTGLVVDQAALYGLIGKLRDLGVKLLAVRCEELPGSK
jgi:hypothetical protein